MKLIVGLGNPGSKYELTRHNAGFLILDLLADKFSASYQKSSKFEAEVGKATIQDQQCILLKPSTYMNLSGRSVRKALDYYKISLDDLIVIYDDIDLTAGDVKTRIGGGHGGHNGVRSIIQTLGDANFSRIKVGIGRPAVAESDNDVTNWVLHVFSEEELTSLEQGIFPAVLDRLTNLLT